MGSTFWAESYFRSLKRTSLISLLTEYLLQYKRVSIPHIGSFELVQEPPQWRMPDQLIAPPAFTTAYLRPDAPTEHQSRFFSSAGDLASFGQQLRNRLRKGPIQWKGFGTLRDAADTVVFEPQPIVLASLQAVPAQKLIRPDATHQVLVGDRQLSKQVVEVEREEVVTVVKEKRVYSWEMVTGWVLLAATVAAIVFLLHQDRFSPAATGLRLRLNDPVFSSR